MKDTDITRRTVNGIKHLANMEVIEYDGLKIVTESIPGAVVITVYCGENPTPISQEAYGNVSSDLDESAKGELSSSSL